MATSAQDQWAQWLLQRRFGGDPQRLQAMLEVLSTWRDRILQNARLAPGERLLDVGCGDGLIAFEALDRVGPHGKVLFSDLSQDLLDHCSSLAQQMQLLDRCQFIQASADDLSMIDSRSVDVVTTRSVLIYVQRKQQAFDEFSRVLKPHGRLSIFEPINRFHYPEPPHLFMGYDVTPIQEIAGKVRAVFERIRERENRPMLDFDERDLLTYAEQAGFAEIHLELHIEMKQPRHIDQTDPTKKSRWEGVLKSAGNPLNPTLEEAIAQALTPDEAEQFTSYLRPLIETMSGKEQEAVAYLWAEKHESVSRDQPLE
jgi:ubiquinone/menaquinone biosynthesis C-methylase UbiE